jgi:hypothetical protein
MICEGVRVKVREKTNATTFLILWNPLSADRLGVGSSWEPLSTSTSQNSAHEGSG